MNTQVIEEDALEIPVEVETQQQIETFGQEVAKLEEQAKSITVTDDVTEEVSLIFIAGCKKTHADIEAYRDAKVRPHNTYVAKVNSGVKPFKDVLSRLISATDAMRSQFLVRKQKMIEEENRRRAAEAERERLEKEGKEKEAREEAERARQEAERIERERIEREYNERMAQLALENKRKADEQAAEDAKRAGDLEAARKLQEQADAIKAQADEQARKAEEERKASEAEQAKLEKKAVTLDAKADIAAASASMVAPEIEVNTSTAARTLASGSRVSTREAQEPYFLNGMPIYSDPIKRKFEEYSLDDARLDPALAKRYFKFDLAQAVRDLKNGVPVPGMALRNGHKTIARKS